MISALHKSIRGSDADAALIYLARMLDGGDALYIARRLVRQAAEDIGVADNNALVVAQAGFEACRQVGKPECDVILAQVVYYLAKAPKSILIYEAMKNAKRLVAENPAFSVPLHLRNAPTQIMRDAGYAQGYHYTPDDPSKPQQFMPNEFLGKTIVRKTSGVEPK